MASTAPDRLSRAQPCSDSPSAGNAGQPIATNIFANRFTFAWKSPSDLRLQHFVLGHLPSRTVNGKQPTRKYLVTLQKLVRKKCWYLVFTQREANVDSTASPGTAQLETSIAILFASNKYPA